MHYQKISAALLGRMCRGQKTVKVDMYFLQNLGMGLDAQQQIIVIIGITLLEINDCNLNLHWLAVWSSAFFCFPGIISHYWVSLGIVSPLCNYISMIHHFMSISIKGFRTRLKYLRHLFKYYKKGNSTPNWSVAMVRLLTWFSSTAAESFDNY